MTSFISQPNKVLYADQFNNLHDTFSRPIVIVKTAEQVLISSNPNNNQFFQNAPFNDQTQKILVSGIFNARILYSKEEPLNQFQGFGIRKEGGDQPVIQKEAGQVRIKLDPTGAQYLFDSNVVQFDGEVFSITSSERPHGLFVPNFYTFFLTKEN